MSEVPPNLNVKVYPPKGSETVSAQGIMITQQGLDIELSKSWVILHRAGMVRIDPPPDSDTFRGLDKSSQSQTIKEDDDKVQISGTVSDTPVRETEDSDVNKEETPSTPEPSKRKRRTQSDAPES
jgi:hypothetical protein